MSSLFPRFLSFVTAENYCLNYYHTNQYYIGPLFKDPAFLIIKDTRKQKQKLKITSD